MSRKFEVLSAYLDGELDSHTARKVETRLREDEEFRRAYESLTRLKEVMSSEGEPDYVESAARLWERLEGSVDKKRREPLPLWRRNISIPMPLAAAAAVLFFSIAGIAIYLAGAGHSTNGAPAALAGVDPRELDITIQVDDAQARELIRWLEERKDVQQVNIQLPETPRFELIGEPVLMPASDARELSR